MTTYLDHRPEPRYVRGKSPDFHVEHSWAQFTSDRLAWLYGERHTIERRAATTADIAAWGRLGAGRAAA